MSTKKTRKYKGKMKRLHRDPTPVRDPRGHDTESTFLKAASKLHESKRKKKTCEEGRGELSAWHWGNAIPNTRGTNCRCQIQSKGDRGSGREEQGRWRSFHLVRDQRPNNPIFRTRGEDRHNVLKGKGALLPSYKCRAPIVGKKRRTTGT